ncbi:MAG TPA: NAD-dependent epimerase/dehydratase family protein [Gammaproteobacteria bacterium]|jgi:dihydroflavonol-4-reductase|nr:NAD-dependent epimerase/dehydratase family protein [Gammaproteobacteria bacterium]
MSERVLLTGITGYIGQHCGAELLKAGYEVVGTVRSQQKAAAARAALERVAPVDKLHIVEADLLSDEGWDAAAEGCTYVLHVASPFFLSEPKDENEFINPAVEGTKRVVSAAMRAGVKRLVLTSSVASVSAGRGTGTYGPDSWSDTEADIGSYSKSKTLAERAAWELVDGADMELAVINPAAVLGPSLGANPDAQSIVLMTDMITGKMPMYPDLTLGVIDVRDVARLHVKAMTAEGAAGKRFIASTAEPVEMGTIAGLLKSAGYDKAPSRKAPTFLLKVMSLFDKDTKAMLPLLGTRATLDNSAALEILDWDPTPVEDTITEMAAAISAP